MNTPKEAFGQLYLHAVKLLFTSIELHTFVRLPGCEEDRLRNLLDRFYRALCDLEHILVWHDAGRRAMDLLALLEASQGVSPTRVAVDYAQKIELFIWEHRLIRVPPNFRRPAKSPRRKQPTLKMRRDGTIKVVGLPKPGVPEPNLLTDDDMKTALSKLTTDSVAKKQLRDNQILDVPDYDSFSSKMHHECIFAGWLAEQTPEIQAKYIRNDKSATLPKDGPPKRRGRTGVSIEQLKVREKVVERWNDFKQNYKLRGYPKASYELFTQWAVEMFDDMPSDDPNEIQRVIDAHRKSRRKSPEK